MKCVKRTLSEDGKVPNFIELECEIPTQVTEHEIVVQVKACGLSLINHKILSEIHKKQNKSDYNVGQDVAGIVTFVGNDVTHVKVGDHIVGILPLNSLYSGCGEYCVFTEYDVIKKPHHMSFEEAAASIGDCLKAYTALYFHGKVGLGDTVLILDGASHFSSIAIQLAHFWGAKVLTTYSSSPEKIYVESLQTAQIIELKKKNNMLYSVVSEETGGLGVDCVVDNGVRMFTHEDDIELLQEDYKYPLPHKNDVISCLGFGGKWVTSQSDLQLDPPDSQQLFFRNGRLCFLFEPAWVLTNSQQGKYQHILKDSIRKVADGILKCNITKTVKFENVTEVLKTLSDERIGKVVLKF